MSFDMFILSFDIDDIYLSSNFLYDCRTFSVDIDRDLFFITVFLNNRCFT